MKNTLIILFITTLICAYAQNSHAYRIESEKSWLEKVSDVFTSSKNSKYFSDKFQNVEHFLVFIHSKGNEALPPNYTSETIKEKIKSTIDSKYSHCSTNYTIEFIDTLEHPLTKEKSSLSIYFYIDYSERSKKLYGRVMNYRKGYTSFKDLALNSNSYQLTIFDMSENPDQKIEDLYKRIGYTQ